MSILIPHPTQLDVTIEAKVRTTLAELQVVHCQFTAPPPDTILRAENLYHLELSLTSRHRNARACYTDHWNPRRFEPLGDIFMASPKTDLLVKSSEENPFARTLVVCKFSPETVHALLDEEVAWTDKHLVSSLDVQSKSVRNLLLRLAEEAKNPGLASDMLIDLVIGQLAVELVRYGNALDESGVKGRLAPWQLKRIDERLREACKVPTLTELAELCRLSVRQMSRGFRASRGCSIGDYVISSQMSHAKRLLATDASITSIGYALGFSSSSNFCSAFRRTMGMTPRQFRLRLLEA